MSDHALAVIGLIVGVVGIVIGILTGYYFYLKSRERIDPRYLLQHEPLVGSSSGAMTEVSVLFRGTKVTNLNRCILAIWNRGTRVITRGAVPEHDKIKVQLPEKTIALGTGVAWSTRPAINLSAHIDEIKSAVTVDFDFLDKNDGGLIEILYQGDPKASPTLTGSIMGAPRGIRSVVGIIDIDEDEENEVGSGVWKGWLVAAIALCALTVISSLTLGTAYPLSIVAYTLIAEIIIGVLFFAALKVFLQRMVGFPEFWKETPQSGGDRQKLTID
jgi:hypothetical protein